MPRSVRPALIITLHQQVSECDGPLLPLVSTCARARPGQSRDNFLMQHNWNASNHDASSCPLTTLQSRTHLFNAYVHRQFEEENSRLPNLDQYYACSCFSVPLFWGLVNRQQNCNGHFQWTPAYCKLVCCRCKNGYSEADKNQAWQKWECQIRWG